MCLARALGYIFVLIALLAAPAISQANSQFAIIEIRLVPQKPSGGPMLVVEGRGQTLEVEHKTLLGPSDFGSVGQLEWVEGKPGFNVALTPAGAQKYQKISAENVGRMLAIIVDGKIVMTPKILDPVRAQGFLLTFNTEAEARGLAAKLRQAIAPN
jgi:Preprotein translocase subunit SecD